MWLRALTKCAKVHAALFGCPAERHEPPYRCTVTPLSIPHARKLNGFQKWIGDCTSALPQSFRLHAIDECRRQVAELHPEMFDAVFSYRIDFGYFAGVLGHPQLLLDVDDPEHVRKRDRLKLVGSPDGVCNAWLELMKLRRFERRAVAGARTAFVCQQRDLESFPDGDVRIVTNAVEVPPQLPPRQTPRDRILFLANLTGSSHSPNVDGIRWFVHAVWPAILKRAPHTTLQITGAISDGLRSELAQRLDVCVTGFCDDLPGAFRSSSISIAPIRFATGTRIKILESMAWGCPVVSTTKGAEGLPVQHGREILIADDPDDLASACINLMQDDELQQKLAHAGHELVAEKFSQRRLAPSLVAMLQELLPQRLSTEHAENLAAPIRVG
jgi:glycosyltransferase involved in cell wall biosynthesis